MLGQTVQGVSLIRFLACRRGLSITFFAVQQVRFVGFALTAFSVATYCLIAAENRHSLGWRKMHKRMGAVYMR
jgi:hypothetical protein